MSTYRDYTIFNFAKVRLKLYYLGRFLRGRSIEMFHDRDKKCG